MSLHYLTTSPLAKGLFRATIGVSFSYDYLRKKHAIGNVWQKEQQGLKFAAAKKVKSVSELRKIPAEDLIAPDAAVEPFTRAALGGGVNPDGWAFPLAYPDALEVGLENDVPTLTGMTADDYGPPVEFMNTTVANFADAVAKLFGENQRTFLALKEKFFALAPVATDREACAIAKRTQLEYRLTSIHAWAERRARTARTPVFTYRFDQPIPWPEHPAFGAFHSSDLIYAFNNLNRMDRPWTEVDRRVADQVSSYWVNFVKTGNLNGAGLPKWRAFESLQPATMTLGAHPGPQEIAGRERFEFYQRLMDH